MRVTVEWSNGQVEELDVHRDFAEKIDKIGNPLTIQTYMKDVWDINIPTNMQVPADLQMVFENFFRFNKPCRTGPSESREKSVDELIAIHKWFAWQRVLVALNEIASTVEQWNRALTAAARVPETNFVAEKRIQNAGGGSKQRGKSKCQDTRRRIQPALDKGERDEGKLRKFYRDSFAYDSSTRAVHRNTLANHLKRILSEHST